VASVHLPPAQPPNKSNKVSRLSCTAHPEGKEAKRSEGVEPSENQRTSGHCVRTALIPCPSQDRQGQPSDGTAGSTRLRTGRGLGCFGATKTMLPLSSGQRYPS
jgi:hypothetical protein